MAYPKAKVTQVRSTINRPRDQKATIQALGLGKINRTVEKEVTPQILGMLKKVSHLVKIEPLDKELPKELPSEKAPKAKAPKTVEPKAEEAPKPEVETPNTENTEE